MTPAQTCSDCPNVERRQGERRKTVQRTFAYCAKLVGIIVVCTTAVAVGAAVTLSTAIAQRVHEEHKQEMQSLRDWSQDMEQRILRLEAR